MPQKLLQKPSRRQPKSEQLLTQFESAARKQGYSRIAGIDEAGRGPLAGPVVAAACLLAEGVFFPGIDDSKCLTEKKRLLLFQQIQEETVYGIGIVSPEVIDEINILQATHRAMREAVAQLSTKPDYLLVDGRPVRFPGYISESIIKGDSRSQSIAAASILAKVTRDQIMLDYHEQYPEYGFDQHKGYGTIKHRQMLTLLGPSPIHRQSFSYRKVEIISN